MCGTLRPSTPDPARKPAPCPPLADTLGSVTLEPSRGASGATPFPPTVQPTGERAGLPTSPGADEGGTPTMVPGFEMLGSWAEAAWVSSTRHATGCGAWW